MSDVLLQPLAGRGHHPHLVPPPPRQVVDVRSSVLLALEHDRQEGPPSQMQISLLDGYLAATDTGGGGRALASGGGATPGGGGGGAADAVASREEMRALLADRAAARMGGGEGSAAPPGAEPRGEGAVHDVVPFSLQNKFLMMIR